MYILSEFLASLDTSIIREQFFFVWDVFFLIKIFFSFVFTFPSLFWGTRLRSNNRPLLLKCSPPERWPEGCHAFAHSSPPVVWNR